MRGSHLALSLKQQLVSIFLRYYATYKVRKFESLFCKINTLLQKTTTFIRLPAEQMFLVNIKYTYFSILDVAFAVPFLFYFWTYFCYIALLYLGAQKVSQIFRILFKTGDFNIFIVRVFFSIYIQLKSSFSDEKSISGEITLKTLMALCL